MHKLTKQKQKKIYPKHKNRKQQQNQPKTQKQKIITDQKNLKMEELAQNIKIKNYN